MGPKCPPDLKHGSSLGALNLGVQSAPRLSPPLDPAPEVHGALKTLIIKWLEKSRGRAAGHGAGTTTRPFATLAVQSASQI